MNTLDIVVAVIVLLGLARGFQKGLIKSFIGLIGWLVALVAASKLASSTAHLFAGWVSSPQLQIALGFLLIVLVVVTLLQIVGMLVENILSGLNLKILDRFAGGVFGAAKGVLIVLIILSLTAPVLQRFSVWKSSVLVPQLLPYAPLAMQFSKDVVNKTMPNMLPDELKNPSSQENKQDDADNMPNDVQDVSLEDISVINDETFENDHK